jgi:hypothetical protein
MKYLGETRERLRGEYENIGVATYSLVRHKGLPLLLLLPPGLTNPSMPPPPPPPPSTPTTHRNNIQPPTPDPTHLAGNGQRAGPMAEEPSPTKRLKIANVQTRTSPRNPGPRPARMSSESSVKNTVMPMNPRKDRVKQVLSDCEPMQ